MPLLFLLACEAFEERRADFDELLGREEEDRRPGGAEPSERKEVFEPDGDYDIVASNHPELVDKGPLWVDVEDYLWHLLEVRPGVGNAPLENDLRWHGFAEHDRYEMQLTYPAEDGWMSYWSCWFHHDRPDAVVDCEMLERGPGLNPPEPRTTGWFMQLKAM